MASPVKDKFAPFVVSTYAYKTVDDHPILLDVFIPRKLVEAGPSSEEWKVKRPVMLFYHAGWLVGGQRDFQPWWSQWILDLMVKHGAIGVTADYRLIPEATFEDVYGDLYDAWDWVVSELCSAVEQQFAGLRPDLSRILLAGSSAGGYSAIQVGLSVHKPNDSEPKARTVIALYPYVSIRTPYWTEDYEKNILGAPQLPESIIDDHLASIAAYQKKIGKRPILTSVPMLKEDGTFSDRALLAVCAQQHGRILEYFGPERDSSPGKRKMHPEDRITDGRKLPPIAIVQGSNDTICPVEGGDLFVDHLRKYKAVEGLAEGRPLSEVLAYFRVPGEHLFETESGLNAPDKWIKDCASFIEKHWLN